MASKRLIEVVYQLKDRFTGVVGKITGGYRKMGDEAEKAAGRTERSFKRTGESLTAVTGLLTRMAGVLGIGFGARAAAGGFSDFVNDTDKLAKLSQKLGYSVEELQRLGYIADRNGVAFESMAVALQRATRRIAEVATTGKGQAAPILEALGLSAAELTKLPLDQRMAKLSDAFASVADQGERVRLAFGLFDTEGVDMVRILQNGSAEFRKLNDEATRFAAIVDGKTAKAAEGLADDMTNLTGVWERLKVRFLAPVARELVQFADNVGLGADPMQRLQVELERTERRIERLKANLEQWPNNNAAIRGLIDSESRARQLRYEMRRLTDQQKEYQAQQEAEQARLREQQGMTKLLTDAVTGLGDAYKIGADKAKAALTAETAQLRAAKTEQASIVQEFEQLLQDVSGQQQDANIIDANYLARQAQAALDNGNLDEALKKAREAGDMLRELKKDGQGGIDLTYLAKQLKTIGESVGQTRVNKELIDVQAATKSVEDIGKMLDQLNGKQITVKILPEITGGGPIADTLRDELTRRGAK